MFAALAPRLTTLKTFGLPIATLSILSARLDFSVWQTICIGIRRLADHHVASCALERLLVLLDLYRDGHRSEDAPLMGFWTC